jgi:hypothetical protein
MGLFARTRDFLKKKKTFTADEFIFKYLRNGGSPDCNVDGSIASQVFEYVVPAGKHAWLHRINTEGHNGSITRDNFLGIAALTNGILFQVLDDQDNILIDFTDGEGIKITTEFSALSGVDTQIDTRGGGEDGIAIRWTFDRAGEPIFMKEGYKFRLIVRDNLTGISQLRMMLQGIIVRSDIKTRP